MSLRPTSTIVAVFLLGTAGLALANRGGPPAGHTGAPAVGGVGAEQTCARSGCHANAPVNVNGSIELQGLPAQYEFGQTYPLTVRLSSSATSGNMGRRWGFELTFVREADGNSTLAGSLVAGQGLGFAPAAGQFRNRAYLTHTLDSVQTGETSPGTWTFDWIAPESDQGVIAFYFAGNAANGNNANSGDNIYTGSAGTSSLVPVEQTTWGELKTQPRWLP